MQKETYSLVIDRLKNSVIEAAWIQWRSLGSFVDADRTATSMVDPEATLLVSLSLQRYEKRLWDVLTSWAKNGSRLFSVQRVKNMLKNFPNLQEDGLLEFASIAKTDGNDFRWKRFAIQEYRSQTRKHELWKQYPRNWEPSALLLRLRLGFGVGIVPDLLGFLISIEGNWASPRLIAQATSFSVASIRRAADSMAAGQLIMSTQEKPVKYRVDNDGWCNLLNIEGKLPPWRYWYQVYMLAIEVISFTEGGQLDNMSPYMRGSILRDILEKHREAFTLNQISHPDFSGYSGDNYIVAFNETITKLSEWIDDSI